MNNQPNIGKSVIYLPSNPSGFTSGVIVDYRPADTNNPHAPAIWKIEFNEPYFCQFWLFANEFKLA